MYSEMNDDLRDQLTETLSTGLSDDAIKGLKKQVTDIICNIEEDIMYRLKEELAPNLSSHVKNMAQKTVESILDGNEQEMRRYLSCNEGWYNGRSGEHNIHQRSAHEQHPVIHGNLFEQGCVELRKKIVEAHADLLKNERILDLEDQVKSLVAQVNKANHDKDEMWERFRHVA